MEEEEGRVSQSPPPAIAKRKTQSESPLSEESVVNGDDAPAMKRGRGQGSTQVETAPRKPSLQEKLLSMFSHLRNVTCTTLATVAAESTAASGSESGAESAHNGDSSEVCVTFDLRAGEGMAMRGKFEVAVERGEVTAHGFTLRQPLPSTSGRDGATGGATGATGASGGGGATGGGQSRVLTKADFEVGDWDPSPLFHAGLAGARIAVTGRWWRGRRGRQSARRKKSKQSTSAARPNDDDADLNELNVSFSILDATMSFTGSESSSAANAVFLTPALWVQYSEELLQLPPQQQQHIRILICGAKGSGKSTLAKYLANRFLSDDSGCRVPATRKVFFVNTDVGQTELTPPGIVATHCLSGHGGGGHKALFVPQPLQGASFVNSRHFSPTQAAAYFVGTVRSRVATFVQPSIARTSSRVLTLCWFC